MTTYFPTSSELQGTYVSFTNGLHGIIFNFADTKTPILPCEKGTP